MDACVAGLDDLARANFARLAQFHVSIYQHFPTCDKRLGCAAGFGNAQKFDQLVKLDEVLVWAKIEFDGLHENGFLELGEDWHTIEIQTSGKKRFSRMFIAKEGRNARTEGMDSAPQPSNFPAFLPSLEFSVFVSVVNLFPAIYSAVP